MIPQLHLMHASVHSFALSFREPCILAVYGWLKRPPARPPTHSLHSLTHPAHSLIHLLAHALTSLVGGF